MTKDSTQGPNIWSSARRGKKVTNQENIETASAGWRTPYEHDFDRLLFSTPVRRLSDKTQVFPLEQNDSVRTRLTHSHEVSNLARSLGNQLARRVPGIFGDQETSASDAAVILAAVGLAHDLGNPPFGHQGEAAISRWFKDQKDIFEPPDMEATPEGLRGDFTSFEGNAQTIRLVTRLQVSAGGYGLDLTAATLAALMKYTVPSAKVAGKEAPHRTASNKKFGYFASESDVVEWIRDQTGLREGQRHPLTWLMEACDDIAYSVLDVEDAIKKAIVSPEDVLAYLKRKVGKNEALAGVVSQLEEDFDKADRQGRTIHVSEIKTSYLRTRLIEALIGGALDAFVNAREQIYRFENDMALLGNDSEHSKIYDLLKDFAFAHAYKSHAVLRIEAEGAVVISKLMDCFWSAICNRADIDDLASRRDDPFDSYVYALISDNYRNHFETDELKDSAGNLLPIRYREMQLLTDMISGMTDGFAMSLYQDLEKLRRHRASS